MERTNQTANTAAMPPAGLTQRTIAPADLRLATIDREGRLPLGLTARALAWTPRRPLLLRVHAPVLYLVRAGCNDRPQVPQLAVELDRRLRVQLPYGIRAVTGFRPGTRLLVLACMHDEVVSAVRLSEVIERLAGPK